MDIGVATGDSATVPALWFATGARTRQTWPWEGRPMTAFGVLPGEPFTHTAGFGGLCAVIAALITVVGVAITLVQRSRVTRRDNWWARFVWVVDHSSRDLGGPLTISMLDQLTTTARQLSDADLIAFAERYTRHVYAQLPDASPTARHQAHNEPQQPEGDLR